MKKKKIHFGLLFYLLFSFYLINYSLLIAQGKNMNYNKLSQEEENVIIHKGTEKPFTGKFYNHKEKGTYVCKQCGAPLYKSEDKFDSGCG